MAHSRRMGVRGQAGAKRLPRHLRNEDLPTNTFTPRTYQVELLDSALHRNTVVCMSSWSGRTFIAVMLMKELACDIRKPLSDGGKRGIYLVNSDALVEQQAQAIQHPSDLIVGQYTEGVGVSAWSCDQWSKEIDRCHVMVMTADVFLKLLQGDIFPMAQANLLVFDDCHLALEEHPYQHIMELYRCCPDTQRPRILGLTTSLLNKKHSTPQVLATVIKNLEDTLCSTAETSTLVISERYGIKPAERVIECEDYEDNSGLVDQLGEKLEQSVYFLDECNIEASEELDNRDPKQIPRAALVECHNILYQLGPWCAACIADMLVVQIEKIDKQKEFIALHKKFLRFAATTLRMVSKIFEEHFKTVDYDVDVLLSLSTPKVRELVGSLRKYRPDTDFIIISENLDDMSDSDSLGSADDGDSDFTESGDEDDDDDRSPGSKQIHVAIKKLSAKDGSRVDLLGGEEEKYLCGIVFVHQQHEAFALNKFLEEVCAWDEGLCFVKSSHITGRSGAAREGRMYKKQEDILRKFRMQDLNLLISTSVLEEGVDVPKCNLVVRFDVPKDYRSYSQSKGRARARDAEFILLIEEENYDEFEQQLRTYKDIEKVLIGRSKPDDDSDSGVSEEDCGHDLLQPYMPTSEEGGVQVSLASSISLINRYCAKLPSDAFTHLTASCCVRASEEGGEPQYTASLRLPINSPIKENIQGMSMPTKLLAKKAVALKMCEILHRRGELDEQLMPVGKEMFQLEEEEGGDWEGDQEDTAGGEARPGTTKRKQYYCKKIANDLVGSHPLPDTPCNLYFINMILTGAITEDQNTRGRKIYAPEDTPRCFGILTSNTIPLVPLFPVFTRSGEVTVSLDLLHAGVCLNESELDRLKGFHKFAFSNVLRLEKDPMDFRPEDAALGYILVPLNQSGPGDLAIDWDYCGKVEQSLTVKKPVAVKRAEDVFQFDKEEYEDAVVMPSYRNIDQPQHFYVAEIRYDLNPLSSFPSPELYKTFRDYYTTKYGLKITNLDQPLLDVDHTSARLNLLIPRYMNQKGVALPTSSAETKKARRENLQQKQILVPELCDVHVLPASLWRKAVCLPAILYRMNYLLLAEEIRKNLAAETRVGVIELPEGFRFPQLDFGFDTSPEKLKNASDEVTDEEKPEEQTDCGTDSSDSNGGSCERGAANDADGGGAEGEETLQEKREDSSDGGEIDSVKLESSSIPVSLVSDDDCVSGETREETRASCSDDGQPIQLQDGPLSCDQISQDFVADRPSIPPNIQQHGQIISKKSEHQDITLCNGLDDSHSVKPAIDDQMENTSVPVKTVVDKPTTNIIQDETDIIDGKRERTEHVCGNVTPENYCKPCTLKSDLCTVISHKNGCLPIGDIETGNKNLSRETYHDQNCRNYVQCDRHTKACSRSSTLKCKLSPGISDKIDNGEDIWRSDEMEEEEEKRHCVGKQGIQSSVNENMVEIEDLGDCDSDDAAVSDGVSRPAHHEISQEGLRQGLKDLPIQLESLSLGTSSASGWDSGDSHSLPPSSTSQGTEVWSAEPGTGPDKDGGINVSSEVEACSVKPKPDQEQAEVRRNNACEADGKGNEKSPLVRTADNSISETQDVFKNVVKFAVELEEDEPLPVEEESDFSMHQISLDTDIDLSVYVGPSPCTVLQAFTMSNANDFFSLERLETIGDSFLKYAITVYLYCSYPGIHEGKLSYLRSKQVSNYNLYRLGKKKGLAECMISTKFEPYENWLPPGFVVNEDKKKGPVPKVVITPPLSNSSSTIFSARLPSNQSCDSLNKMAVSQCGEEEDKLLQMLSIELEEAGKIVKEEEVERGENSHVSLTSYSLQLHHSVPDKSIADCVEALIGCYLTSCGKMAALRFMSWLGLKVLPRKEASERRGDGEKDPSQQDEFDPLPCPPTPLLTHDGNAEQILVHLLDGYDKFEKKIGYTFRDRSYLLQAFTHASYHYNTVTDCYQRLEFLGDAILDYVITRHLYEDSCKYSPGVLTDLRSALVNNNIFAALAVKWDFHKFFKAISPALFHVTEKFVSRQKENEDDIDLEDEEGEEEDPGKEQVELEVPKALGDIFESVAGAIYLDSGMSLDVVWRVYYQIMKPQIDKYLKSIPKSPVRELLEMEPETAKFEKPERTMDGKIRVSVNVVGKGVFTGIGRNYRIAKSAAAKKALRSIRNLQIQGLI